MDLWSEQELLRADEYVRRYEQMNSRREWWNLVRHLGDDPRGGWVTWSAHSNKLPTIRKSSGLHAMPAAHRHLTMRELYASMGFPVTPLLASVSQVPLYNPWRNSLTYARSRQALGNSHIVPNVGCVTAVMLACCRQRQPSDVDMGLEVV